MPRTPGLTEEMTLMNRDLLLKFSFYWLSIMFNTSILIIKLFFTIMQNLGNKNWRHHANAMIITAGYRASNTSIWICTNNHLFNSELQSRCVSTKELISMPYLSHLIITNAVLTNTPLSPGEQLVGTIIKQGKKQKSERYVYLFVTYFYLERNACCLHCRTDKL